MSALGNLIRNDFVRVLLLRRSSYGEKYGISLKAQFQEVLERSLEFGYSFIGWPELDGQKNVGLRREVLSCLCDSPQASSMAQG